MEMLVIHKLKLQIYSVSNKLLKFMINQIQIISAVVIAYIVFKEFVIYVTMDTICLTINAFHPNFH